MEGVTTVIQNPRMRKEKYLRVIMYLSIVSLVLFGLTRLLIGLPIYLIRLVVWIVAPHHEGGRYMDDALTSISRVTHDLMTSAPFLALLFMRYLYPKPLDDLFVESLRFIDSKHPERPPYASSLTQRKYRQEYWSNMKDYTMRTWRKLRLGVLLYLLSLIPMVGPFVFPAAGAYATFKALGKTQGIVAGICFLLLPRWTGIALIRGLISMRALMRELLEPYFVRMNMDHTEKRKWFSARKDILFGFSAVVYIMIRLPIIGFINYGIAQAAAAYILTMVTEPVAVKSQ
ncbi:hypothetical protein DFQ30_003169 [Apophysomyces sp. BC1015]|nr:hypothetical protein DFQ30_003169 [Apophysomyces sp. BC1015]